MKTLAHLDWLILLPILIISFLGLLVIFSVDRQSFYQQLIFFIFGFSFYLFLANFDYKIFKNFSFVFFLLSLILLLATFILGKVTRGSVRWIQIGSLSFQSSEFVKPLLILSLAGYALRLNFSKLKNLFLYLLYFLLPAFLIFKQPDLGNSLVVFVIWLGITFSAGIRPKLLLLGLILLLGGSPFIWKALKPYQQERIISFLNPQADPLGSGYHLLQAKITVGSGQIWGRGLGQGTQSQLEFLPERQTDFIFASLAEELGFLGSTLLLFSYFVLLLRILTLARQASDKFGFLICLAVFLMLFFQIFVNVGMNLGMVPITGVTLPLVSAGGSSLIATLISLGLTQNVGQFLKRREIIEIK